MLHRKAMHACALVVCLAASALGASSAARANTLIGVDTVEFSWNPASGNPPQYGVWISRNGGDFKPLALVNGTRVELPASTGEQLAIYVQGVRPHPLGGYEVGPASPPSEAVTILASPQLPVDGSWVLHCSTCPLIEYRELADAAVSIEQYGLPAPWKVLGRSLLDIGTNVLAWYRSDTHHMAFTDTDDLFAPPVGPIAVPESRRVALFDYDGDGIDEILFHDLWTPSRVEIWQLDGEALEHVVDLPVHVPVSGDAVLGPVADFTGDGLDDLLWLYPATGHIAVWSPNDYDPDRGRWTWSESYVIDLLYPSPEYRPVAAADFDGSGSVDLLWRGPDGILAVTYLDGARMEFAAPIRYEADDVYRDVVGTVGADGVPGAEIALQDRRTGRIWLLRPPDEQNLTRLAVAVLDPGREWRVVDVAR